MLSEPGRDNVSASPLCAALWLSETSKGFGRQHTCIIDNSKLSYRFCCSLMWRWMQVQYPRPFQKKITHITLWFQSAFVMRDGFKMGRPEPSRTSKCLVDQAFHIRQSVHMWQSKNDKDVWTRYILCRLVPNCKSLTGMEYQNKKCEYISAGEKNHCRCPRSGRIFGLETIICISQSYLISLLPVCGV